MSATRPPAFDDRFTTPIEASRRGAHRARPKAASVGLPVAAGVVVILVVLVGGYKLFSSPSTPSSNVSAAGLSDEPTSTAALPSAAAALPSAAPGSTQNPTATANPAGTTSSGNTSGVDHTINLVVLNSVPVQGLAKRVQAKLEPNGWKVARTGNSTNRNLATTKIYYGRALDKATATALQSDLGYGTVVKDGTVATKGLVVVLGQDAG